MTAVKKLSTAVIFLRCLNWVLPRRFVGFDAQHIRENAALLGAEDTLVARGVEHRLALVGRYRAQVAEGALHQGLALYRLGGPAARRKIDLHPVLRGQVLDHLGTCQAALSLLLRQLVNLMQLLHHSLLVAWSKPPEAGIAAQGPFLLLNGKVEVLIEPVA